MSGPDDPRVEPDSAPSQDAWAGMKVAGLAVVAWAIIGVVLRATSGFELADELFAAALLLPALVGIGISTRGVLTGPSRFQSTVGLMVNVMLAVGAVILALSTD